MRVIIVSGFIVADAEKKSSKNGREYVTFRIGNNEYDDEKDDKGNVKTRWFRVTSFQPRHISLVETLKKGRPVYVTGSYRDDVYSSAKTGTCEISRDIIADRIDFQIGRETPQQTDTTPQVTNSATTAAPATPTQTAKAQPAKTAAPSPAATATAEAVDDLPF